MKRRRYVLRFDRGNGMESFVFDDKRQAEAFMNQLVAELGDAGYGKIHRKERTVEVKTDANSKRQRQTTRGSHSKRLRK